MNKKGRIYGSETFQADSNSLRFAEPGESVDMDKPNILILYTDQQRFDTIAALGAKHAITPNLDRLAGCGRSYLNAYSSSPACMPTRHDMLTGVSARYHGYWTNAKKPMQSIGDFKTMPEMLKGVGYDTFAVGKMHYYPVRDHHGWSQMQLMEEVPTSRGNDEYLQYLESVGLGHILSPHGVRTLFYHSPQVSPVPEEHLGTTWVADRTIDLIDQSSNQPFFIMSGWIDPHPPYSVPAKYLEMYRDAELPAPCSRPSTDERHYPLDDRSSLPDALQLRRLREAYFASCAFVDVQIGKVLDALEQSGRMADTVVIFTSDHGEMLGDRQAFQKFTPYEGSAHVPLIISGPGFNPGSRCQTPVSSWDLTSTVLDLAGVVPPPEQPFVGMSLRDPAFDGDDDGSDRIICFHHGGDPDISGTPFRRFVAAVGYNCKFIHYSNGGGEEFYDLGCDPWEQDNLIAGNRVDEDVLSKLRNACIAFEHCHGQAERVDGNNFIDEPYSRPQVNVAGYFGARIKQNPCWPEKYTEKELNCLIEELNNGLGNEAVFIPDDHEWKDELISHWRQLGGDPESMLKFVTRMKTVTKHKESNPK
jgi:arylsulfatase A-like enzyme